MNREQAASARRAPLALALVVAAWIGAGHPPAGATPTTDAHRTARARGTEPRAPSPFAATLGARLKASGRAEVRFVRESQDPLSDATRREPGRLVLEPPSRAALEFDSSGERVTLRADGGEWLHPGLRQLVTFDADQVAGASMWWRLLMNGQAKGVRVRAITPRRLELNFEGDAGLDHAVLELGRDGLPTRFEIPEAGGVVAYRFNGWAFRRPRGPAAFRQSAPPGFDVVAMP